MLWLICVILSEPQFKQALVRFCLKIIPALVPLNPSSCTHSFLPLFHKQFRLLGQHHYSVTSRVCDPVMRDLLSLYISRVVCKRQRLQDRKLCRLTVALLEIMSRLVPAHQSHTEANERH